MRTQKDRKITSVYLDRDVREHIHFNASFESFSDWVNATYRSAFMKIETEADKLKYYQEKANECLERIKSLKENKEPQLIPDGEIKWIKTEGRSRVARGYPSENILRFFNNEFNRKLNKRQFEIYLKHD